MGSAPAAATDLPPLPTQKTPGWEFTDLSELDLDAFSPAEAGDAKAIERADMVLNLPAQYTRQVQVDASPFVETAIEDATGADSASELPTEPLISTLGEARERYPQLVEDWLGSLVDSDDPFVARNEPGQGGALIYVPAGKRLTEPVHLAAIQDSEGMALSYRTLIVLEEGAEAEIWEQWVSTDRAGEGLFSTVTELHLGQNANLRYISAQGLGDRSWLFATQRAEVGRDANLDWIALGFGSARGKVRMDTRLAGQGANARVTGAYAGNGSQHLDFDTTQVHAAPSTTSDLAFRGVLEDSATAVWRGMIRVDRGAQQTDAFQESRNLILSKSAHADAIPGLEIEADDVRCTHAAAVAQIDAEQLHYLRSHGLSESEARSLIIEGFLEALVDRLEGPSRAAVSVALERRLGEILGARS